MLRQKINSRSKWFILILGFFTNALVVAVPGISLSVLLPSINQELNMDVVQAGMAWGIAALLGVFAFLLAGLAIDRFGPRMVLVIACLLAGVLGAARGLATNFLTLMLTIALMGFFTPFIPLSSVKNTRLWFSSDQIGLANGVLSLGMAVGFFTGSMFSASFIAPWVGGWRNTFFIYGLIGALFALPWLFSPSPPKAGLPPGAAVPQPAAGGSIRRIAQIRNIWLLGFGLLCFGGAIQGFLGYIPLYLRGLGWPPVRADGLAATFHLASLSFTIPLTLLSDRLKTRIGLAIAAVSLSAAGILLFSFLRGDALWGAVIIAGLARDGIMAILITMSLETRGVNPQDTGVATGFVMIISGVGGLAAPPLGNLLAPLSQSAPFIFWGVLCLFGALCLLLLDRNQLGRVKQPSTQAE